MTDIHCHILPGIDDGAGDPAQSLSMAALAWESGVKTIVATPHFRGTEDQLSLLPRIQAKTEELRKDLHRAGIPLELHAGAEVLCLPQTLMMAKKGRLPTLAGTKYVLTEFYFDSEMSFIQEALLGLQDAGYQPVVAHPERYEAVQKEPGRLEEWFHRGYVIQVNKGSPLGAFGGNVRRTAVELLEHGLVHVLASDGHSARHRTPHMGGIRGFCMEHLGEQYTRILLEENPGRIVQGLPVR